MKTVILVASALCFFLAAFGMHVTHVDLGWFGLGLLAVSFLV